MRFDCILPFWFQSLPVKHRSRCHGHVVHNTENTCSRKPCRHCGWRLLLTLKRCRGWHERHQVFYMKLGKARPIAKAQFLKYFIAISMSPDEFLFGLADGCVPEPVIALPDGSLRNSRQTTLWKYCKQQNNRHHLALQCDRCHDKRLVSDRLHFYIMNRDTS